MADGSLTIEVGRIVFRSWEHHWQTGDADAPAVATAQRLLPADLTRPIYDILLRWEAALLRTSFPYRPYGLRLRPAQDNWITYTRSEDLFIECLARHQALGQACPGWEAAMPVPRAKKVKYGALVFAPEAERSISDGYSLEWRPVYPAEINIDELLGEFSRRFKKPNFTL